MTAKRPNPKKDKSARRRQGRPRPAGRSAPGRATADGLREGLPAAGGVRIRLARAGDEDVAGSLIASVGSGMRLDSELVAALEVGLVGSGVLRALAEGPDAVNELLADGAFPGGERSFQQTIIALTSLLVAVHPDDGVIGVLQAAPPVTPLLDKALPKVERLAGLAKVVKLYAVAVDPAHRSRGVGSALVQACREIHAQLGYAVLYGQFQVGTGLEAFYQGVGFSVADEGGGLELPMFSVPFGIRSGPGEQMFACTLP